MQCIIQRVSLWSSVTSLLIFSIIAVRHILVFCGCISFPCQRIACHLRMVFMSFCELNFWVLKDVLVTGVAKRHTFCCHIKSRQMFHWGSVGCGGVCAEDPSRCSTHVSKCSLRGAVALLELCYKKTATYIIRRKWDKWYVVMDVLSVTGLKWSGDFLSQKVNCCGFGSEKSVIECWLR